MQTDVVHSGESRRGHCMIARSHIALVALLAAVLALLLAPVQAQAQENRDDVYVRVNGTVDLAAGESVDTLVAVNSDAREAGGERERRRGRGQRAPRVGRAG